ncbi:hypothetical protein HanIR_Chr01g0018391 [Helianthus annuus]|nr:hypothetical protein HanIR_Chr01g0018391 [Helianthus annuus]
MYPTCMKCHPTGRCIFPYASQNSQLKATPFVFEHAFLMHFFHAQAGLGLANHLKGPQTLDLVHQIELGMMPLTF